MLWKYRVLDMILLFMSIAIFVCNIKRIRGLYSIDIVLIIISCFFTISYIRNPIDYIIYIKIISGFMFYFLGRIYFNKITEINKYIVNAYIIVISINLILLILGEGFIYWGSAKTFRGVYFFKTDLAAAICQGSVIMMFIISSKKQITRQIYYIFPFIIAPLLLLLANSRIYIILYVILMVIFWMSRREKKYKKYFKINIKTIIILFGGLILSVNLLSYLTRSTFFKEMGFIGFEFNNLEDLFNSSNTQGRDEIWEIVLEYFNNQSIANKLFGVDLITDTMINSKGHNTHNNFLKIVFSIGYIGFITFITFIVQLIIRLNRVKNREVFYITLSLLLIYLINSISNNVIEFTQLTWIPMFYFGVAVSDSYRRIMVEDKKHIKSLTKVKNTGGVNESCIL